MENTEHTYPAMGSDNSKSLQISDENLETFSIFFVDPQVNETEDNRNAQFELKQIINHLKTFDDQNQCHQKILSLSQEDRLILIVSGRCGRQLVPQIHHLRQVSSIYVYCMDKKTNELWAKDFFKIKSVIVQLKDLIRVIKQDQQSRIKIDEPLSINLLNGNFIHSLLLIDVLIRMKSIESDKQQLIQLCKKEYQNNQKQLVFVGEFEKDYRSDKALWWYTRDSFLSRMLNKALRVQNIDLLFLLRFVISDIYRQLKQYQYQSSICVYRGQVMSIDELNTLRQSIGNFISINSFFSMSTIRQEALNFLYNTEITNDLCRVLFIINAEDANVVKSKSFADISSLSEFGNECEILFMIGRIFRLIQIESMTNEQISVIHLQLCDDNEHDLKKLFDHMKNHYGGGDSEVNLLRFGKVLRCMGKYDLAEKMFCRLLKELPSNDPSLGDLYSTLGLVTYDKANYDSSLHWFQKSLLVQKQRDLSNYITIGNLYNSIGNVYRRQKDWIQASDYYNRAIDLFREANDENHRNVAYFYNSIALICNDQQKYSEALYFHKKSITIDRQHLPADHPNIAASHNNIGNVYLNLHDYSLAMENYEESLKIRLKSLPCDHPNVGMSYANIARVHENNRQSKQALEFYEKALAIYQHSFSSQHPYVCEIKSSIQRVSSNEKHT